MNEVNQDPSIGDDGLTDGERELLQTPVSQVPLEQRRILIALRDKKAEHSYAEKARLRAGESV